MRPLSPQEAKNAKAEKRRERILKVLLEKEQYQAAASELMLTFLLDVEAYKRQVGQRGWRGGLKW